MILPQGPLREGHGTPRVPYERLYTVHTSNDFTAAPGLMQRTPRYFAVIY